MDQVILCCILHLLYIMYAAILSSGNSSYNDNNNDTINNSNDNTINNSNNIK